MGSGKRWVAQVEATSLEKQRSTTLLAQRDPEAKKLIAKSLHTFGNDTFVQYLAEKCQVKGEILFRSNKRCKGRKI